MCVCVSAVCASFSFIACSCTLLQLKYCVPTESVCAPAHSHQKKGQIGHLYKQLTHDSYSCLLLGGDLLEQ